MIAVLSPADCVPARVRHLSDHEAGQVWLCRPPAKQAPQRFYLLRAQWRRRAAVAAVLGPAAPHALPVRPAVAVTRQVPCVLAVVLGALLRGHVEQRGPSAEAVEPWFPASPARHTGLELGAGKARAILSPSAPLVSHAAGVPFGLLGACTGALKRPCVGPHVCVVRHATVISKVASQPPHFEVLQIPDRTPNQETCQCQATGQ